MRITDNHVAEWKQRGYVLVEPFLDHTELHAIRNDVALYFPSYEEFAARPKRYAALVRDNEAWVEFPFVGQTLNHVSTHPEILDFVEDALGTQDIILTQSLMWAKYAGTHSFEQTLHLDYPMNTLVHPREEDRFRQIPMILYLSDVPGHLGPTHVVPRDRIARQDYLAPEKHRDQHPDLYDTEVAVVAAAGSLLIFGMDIYHRGSAIMADNGARFSLHLVFRARGYDWMGWRSWPRFATEPAFVTFLEAAHPRQRSVLGFPPPGHRYWTERTIAGVGRRYPNMDMGPYRRAAKAGLRP